jgi:hypothetical protein
MTSEQFPFSHPPPPLPPSSQPRARSRVRRVVLIILGALFALASFGLLSGGAVLMYADRSLRDASGYLGSPTVQVTAPDYAVAATDLKLSMSDPAWHVSSEALGTIRVTATGASPGGIFIGVAPRAEALSYLLGVAYDEPTQWLGAGGGFAYRSHGGTRPLTPPVSQTFWVSQTSGPGPQTLTWTVEPGQWAIVLMNADASRSVSAAVSLAATAPILFGLALGLLIGGGVAMLFAALLLLGGIRLARPGPPPQPVVWPVSGRETGAGQLPPPLGDGGLTYPLRFEGRLDAPPNRWLWLVKWALLIPHFIVLAFLSVAVGILTVVAFFAILFTGRYPRAIFNFNVGVLRWWWRVHFYGYSALGTDRYPPFSLQPDADYPATLEVQYPEHLSRGLVLVKWWLLAIPHYVVLALLVGSATAATSNAGYASEVPYTGLITLLVLFAAIALTFTARYPRGLFDLLMGLNRWVYRVVVYALLMRDEYPPFRLDTGGSEPRSAPTAPAPAPPLGRPRPYGV